MKKLKIQNLKNLSKNWDGRTKELLVFIEGSGNMFGGSSRFVHILVNGGNSVKETGTVETLGVAEGGYNISRGENGPNSSSIRYYKGKTDFLNLYSENPSIEVRITGDCGGSEAALLSVIGAEKDFFINVEEPETSSNSSNCAHEEIEFIDCEGDAESGPITITECKSCGKAFTQFGM